MKKVADMGGDAVELPLQEECAKENDPSRGGSAETAELYREHCMESRPCFIDFGSTLSRTGELESGKEFDGPTQSHENPNRANWKHSEARGAD